MREALDTFLDDSLPFLDPVRAHERTAYGWRGLTEVGEVLEVKATNGVPSEVLVAAAGKPISRREVRNDWTVDIDAYLFHFNLVVAHYKADRLDQALLESDATLKIAPTLRAKFNRAMILLAAGRWIEGFDEYWQCEQQAPFMRPQAREALDLGLTPWRGEDLKGKRLLLLHAHGFGDTLMMLRYVPVLRASGVNAVTVLPPSLHRLAEQCGPVGEIQAGDYFCPILHLLHFLRVTPDLVDGHPYLTARTKQLFPTARRRVGIAWSIGKPSNGDYPREIPLAELVAAFGKDTEIHSVQTQGAEEARQFGVRVREFKDFTDCAELMMSMDEIISVDTAALHLAGAIGHPRVIGLLSHWASWRWAAPWYQNVMFYRQPTAGDWASALAQIHQ